MPQGDPGTRDIAERILEVAAAMIDQERLARAAVERELARRDDLARQAEETLAQKADEEGLPVDTQAALEDAISACGRHGHVAARRRLGDKLYEAIGGLGHHCSWSWLCQQPALSMPELARRIDGRLGRSHAPSQRVEQGGGTHFRRQSKAPRVAVAPDKLPEMLFGLVRGAKVYVPIEDLSEYRMTAGDWNFVVGQVLKKVEMGFVARPAFGAYLLEAVHAHECRNRIPKPSSPPQETLTEPDALPTRQYFPPRKKRRGTR